MVALFGVGCGERGQVIFSVLVPADARLSPLGPRATDVTIFDDRTSAAITSVIRVVHDGGEAQPGGDLAVGTYDFRLDVEGANQLLGRARLAAVEVPRGRVVDVSLQARKPLLFYTGVQLNLLPGVTSTYPPAGSLMAIDTTQPRVKLDDLSLPDCDPRVSNQCPGVTTATSDGLHLLVALPGRIVVLSTALLYPDGGPGRLVATATLAKAAGQPSPPQPLAVRVSPDGALVAVVTNQGLSLAPLPAVLAGATVQAAVLRDAEQRAVTSARTLAWRPDSSGLVVLAGTPWSELNLCLEKNPAVYFEVDRAGNASGGRPAPDSATDVLPASGVAGLASGTLLFAAPCGAGVVTSDGRVVIKGKGIVRMLVAGGQLLAVPDSLVHGDYPGTWSAQVLASDGAKARTFDVPVQRIPVLFSGAQVRTAVEVDPTSDRFVAYELAAAPDGRSLVIASRARYEVSDKPFATSRVVDNQGHVHLTTCSMQVVRNSYRLNEIDLSSNQQLDDGRGAERGYDNVTRCTWQCQTCDDADPPVCTRDPATDCDGPNADGFEPAGLSILFGTP